MNDVVGGDGRHGRLEEIDVLRGLAAFWVVLSHYLPHWNAKVGGDFVIVPLHYGLYAVELFFAISGFVILLTIERCKSVQDFALLRFSRLYPAYWTTLILATVIGVVVFGDTFWPGGFLANFTMFQEFLTVPNQDEVYWSLSVELAFYLNVAWLFALGWLKKLRIVVPLWLCAAIVWALIVQPVRREHRDLFAIFLIFDYASFFAIGIVFFDALRRGWSTFAFATLALAFVLEFVVVGWTGLIVAAVVVALFAAAMRGQLTFLVSKPTLWLGAISFSLYLIHRNLGFQTLDWFGAQKVAPGVAIPATIAGALLLATLITYAVEKPALDRLRSWYRGRKPKHATVS